MRNLAQLLEQPGPVIIDGGLATQLESMGCDISGTLWSAALLATNPRAIVDAHKAYLDAGAEIIIAASYQASRAGFMAQGMDANKADRLIASAVGLARRARDEFCDDNPGRRHCPLVAASVGPYGATLQDGSEYTGAYTVTESQLADFHLERLRVLDDSGADILAVETIPNIREASVLARLLHQVSIPAWVSFACRDEQCLSDGSRLREACSLFACHPNVFAVGINCTPPRFVRSLIGHAKAAAPGKYIVAYPNSGETYHAQDNSWSGVACDFDRDFDVAGWRDAGAKLIGGCCRTGPRDIAAIKRRLAG